jgi:hypothetical protein
MNQTITFFEKSVYGKTLIYPKCDKAILMSGLTGSRTFNDTQLDVIRALGYTVELIELPS